MKTVEEYIELFTQWGESRGIYSGSTWKKQLEKWGEERAEMLYAETKEEFMDAIGDQFVCLVHVNNMRQGTEKDFILNDSGGYFYFGQSYLEKAIICADIAEMYVALEEIARRFSVRFEECLEMAWQSIKDRKCLMINGKLVKYEDLDDEQKMRCDKTQ